MYFMKREGEMGNTNADGRGSPFSNHRAEHPEHLLGGESSTSHQCARWCVCRLAGQERCAFWWVLGSSLLLSLLFGLSLPLRLSLPLSPPGVMVTDPSGTAYPGIPEQLFGSSASVPLRPGDERGSGKTSFSFSPLSDTIESYYSLLCFVLLFS